MALLPILAAILIVVLVREGTLWSSFFGAASGEIVLLCGVGVLVGIVLCVLGNGPMREQNRRESEGEVVYEISAFGIGVEEEELNQRQPWCLFDRWVETDDVFVVSMRKSKVYFILAKAAFDQSQIETIRELMTANISPDREPPVERGVIFTQDEVDEVIASERARLGRLPAIRMWSIWFVLAGFFTFAGTLSVLAWATKVPMWKVLAVVFGLVTAFYLFKVLQLALAPYRTYRRLMLKMKPHRVEFDENGLTYEVQEVELVYRWDAIEAYTELRGAYLLLPKVDGPVRVAISKRAFSSEAERQAFDDRLRSRLRPSGGSR
ncbi:MAG: YcxB family protein [Phycisphaeraceae bacterium]